MIRPTRRGPLLSCALALVIVVLVNSVSAQTGGPGTSTGAEPPPRTMPADQPERGLVYAGLELANSGPCAGMYAIEGTDACTHGPDSLPADDPLPAPADAATKQSSPSIAACEGDGVSGRRVQLMYVRQEDKPDAYASALPSIRAAATQMDDLVWLSAQETGGHRNIRFVTDAVDGGCVVSVLNVVIPAGKAASFSESITAVIAQGHDRNDRKYVMFVDDRVYCGIGQFRHDDSPGTTNLNNEGASYARVDRRCWNGGAALHELGHTIGAVQLTAPHTSRGGHCIDEYDALCYADAPNYPLMTYPCPKRAHFLLDCNHDDYFHTNPPAGSYLANNWNSANAGFLIGAPPAQPVRPDRATITIGRNSATLNWRDTADETSYTILQINPYPAESAQIGLAANTTTFVAAPLWCGKTYRFYVTASNSYGTSTIAQGRPLVATMPSCDSPDSYEPDDSAAQARPLASGAQRIHNLHTAADADWISFTLAEESRVLLRSEGEGRRRMVLINSAGEPIQSVQSRDGLAFTGRNCDADALGVGTHFAVIDSTGGDPAQDDYVVSLTIAPCADLRWNYLPLISR